MPKIWISFTDMMLDVIRHVIKIERMMTNQMEYCVAFLFFFNRAFMVKKYLFAEIYYDAYWFVNSFTFIFALKLKLFKS